MALLNGVAVVVAVRDGSLVLKGVEVEVDVKDGILISGNFASGLKNGGRLLVWNGLLVVVLVLLLTWISGLT